MNIAFLVEGVTELKLYPKWIAYFASTTYTQCMQYHDVVSNQFTIFNVQGIGKMRQEIPAAIAAIHGNPVFDYLVIVIDSDATFSNLTFIQDIVSSHPLPPNCQLQIIVQEVCIETWFIGHTTHFVAARNSTNRSIQTFMSEYDAANDDPEAMPNNRPHAIHSVSTYHAAFLKKMLNGVNPSWYYSKSTANVLIDIPYLQSLEARIRQTPSHLQSFSAMRTFLQSLE